MEEFRERLDKMIESLHNDMPASERESQIDAVLKMADGNLERMIQWWGGIAQTVVYQHNPKYSGKFDEIAALCGEDIDRKIELWRATDFDAKVAHTDFFNGMLPKLQEIAESDPEKVLFALFSTGGNLELFNDFEILNDIITKVNPQLPTKTLTLLRRVSAYNQIDDEEKRFLEENEWRSLKYIAENNSSLEELISAYQSKSHFFNLNSNRAEVYFKAIVDKLKEQPMQFTEAVADGKITFDYRNQELLGIMFEGAKQLKNQGKKIRSIEVDVPLDQYQAFKKINMGELGLDVTIVCKNASEISAKDAKKMIEKGVKRIRLDDGSLHYASRYFTYKLEAYKACREKIDELLEGLSIPAVNDTNREKKVFMQVMQRLANHISPDYDHLSESKNIKEKRRELLVGEGTLRSEDLIKIEEEERKIDYVTPRNMIGGLIMRKSVCGGYAEIVRNTLACCGIEAICVGGLKVDGSAGHAWNQAKLDGKWYNADLTWSRESLLGIDTFPPCLLMNDKDFNDDIPVEKEGKTYLAEGHGKFSKDRTEVHKCYETIPEEELYSYITNPHTQELDTPSKDLHKPKYKEWIDKAATFLTRGKVKQIGEALRAELRRNYERGEACVKEPRDR